MRQFPNATPAPSRRMRTVQRCASRSGCGAFRGPKWTRNRNRVRSRSSGKFLCREPESNWRHQVFQNGAGGVPGGSQMCEAVRKALPAWAFELPWGFVSVRQQPAVFASIGKYLGKYDTTKLRHSPRPRVFDLARATDHLLHRQRPNFRNG
jgi:hypothetical protein